MIIIVLFINENSTIVFIISLLYVRNYAVCKNTIFAQFAVTKCYRLSGWSNRSLLPYSFGGWEVEDQGLAGFGFPWEYYFWLAEHLPLLCSHMGFPQYKRMKRDRERHREEECAGSSISSCKATNSILLGPQSYNLI